MKCNYIHFRLKDKSKINLNKKEILELFKLSYGNNIIKLIIKKIKKNLQIKICKLFIFI